MRACWLKWVGRDWSISADYIWLNYSDANIGDALGEAGNVAEGDLRHKENDDGHNSPVDLQR